MNYINIIEKSLINKFFSNHKLTRDQSKIRIKLLLIKCTKNIIVSFKIKDLKNSNDIA